MQTRIRSFPGSFGRKLDKSRFSSDNEGFNFYVKFFEFKKLWDTLKRQ